MSSSHFLQCRRLSYAYQDHTGLQYVLKQIDLSLEKAEFLAIVGTSGSGKTTLLHVLAGLDTPSEGDVLVHGRPITACRERALTQLRSQFFGFVYQFHHLLPELSVLENVMLPLILQKSSIKTASMTAQTLLKQLGLHRLAKQSVQCLSGGEKQRVAIARAIISEPQCVLADEPTGSLDGQTASEVMDLLVDLKRSKEIAFIIATHDNQAAGRADRILYLQNGMFTSSLS